MITKTVFVMLVALISLCASLGLIVNQMVHQMQAAHAKEVQAYKVQIAELRRQLDDTRRLGKLSVSVLNRRTRKTSKTLHKASLV